MIWALLFAAIMAIFGGDSPYLIPKMNKYVKKCVVDKEKEKEILVLLKESKAERKAYSKVSKKHEKAFKALFYDRSTKQSDFDELLLVVKESRKGYQGTNQEVAIKVQQLLTEDEWIQIKVFMQKDIAKTEKMVNKLFEKSDKSFDKLRSSVDKNITQKDSGSKAVKAVNEYQEVLNEAFTSILKQVLDKNSVQYKYDVTKEELEAYQQDVNEGLLKILNEQIDLHFSLVELTTETEWKKIHKKVVLL